MKNKDALTRLYNKYTTDDNPEENSDTPKKKKLKESKNLDFDNFKALIEYIWDHLMEASGQTSL